MANDNTLAIRLEARIRDFEKQMAKASGTASQEFGKIEKRAQQSASKVSGILSNFGKGLGGGFLAGAAGAISVGALTDLANAATRTQNALRVTGLAGAELTSVYDKLFESAQRNATPLEALATLYGKVALVQKELGVSSDDIVSFTDKVALALRASGASAQSASGALTQLGQALGGGTVRAEEFNSVLEGAPAIAQAVAAGIDAAGGSVAKLRQLVISGEVSSRAWFDGMLRGADILEGRVANSVATTDQGFTRLRNALEKAVGQIDQATGSSESLAGRMEALAGTITAVGNAAGKVADGPLGRFVGVLAQAVTLLQKYEPLSRGIGMLTNPDVIDAGASLLGGGGSGAMDVAQARAEIARLEEGLSKVDATTRMAVEARIADLADLIQKLQYASSGPTTRGGRRGSALAFPDAPPLPGARPGETSGGSGVRTSAKDAFEAEADAFANLIGYTDSYREEQDRVNASIEAMGNIAVDAGSALANALADGKLEAQELIPILSSVIQQLLSASKAAGGLGNLFSSIFGGGAVPSFGTPGGFASMLGIPGYAKGTNFHPGGMAIVGERGPELLNLPRGSQVIPDMRLPAMARAGGGSVNAPVVVNIDARNADREGLARVQAEVAKLKGELPAHIARSVRDARQRNVKL